MCIRDSPPPSSLLPPPLPPPSPCSLLPAHPCAPPPRSSLQGLQEPVRGPHTLLAATQKNEGGTK
eukprot:316560-Rhodomonas_salina.1